MDTLLLLGIVLIIIGIVLITLSSISSAHVKSGGVVVIGPLPIIFGSDKDAIIIAVIGAIILMAIGFLIVYGGFR
jgi:uncharacterized protein (TIGR00304 family)